MHIVIALGGNALLKRGQPLEKINLVENIKIASNAIVELAKNYTITICHGNGPQVGLLALQADAYKDVTPYTLDVLCAESQGQIGYLIQRCLKDGLKDKHAVTIITQVIVNKDDPAFNNPTKPIGPIYNKKQAEKLASEKKWQFVKEGQGLRRAVPSPIPLEIVEMPIIKELTRNGCITICGGGGGISVVNNENGYLCGVESIIDKDLTAAEIAIALNANILMILTDVEGIYRYWGTPEQKLIRSITTDALANMQFAAGTMAPKVNAVCNFIKNTGNKAYIGALKDAPMLLEEKAGTMIT